MSLPYTRLPHWYQFCAVMSPGSVRMGRVKAITGEDAKAMVQKRFLGGYFYPNQIYVWDESDILVIE